MSVYSGSSPSQRDKISKRTPPAPTASMFVPCPWPKSDTKEIQQNFGATINDFLFL